MKRLSYLVVFLSALLLAGSGWAVPTTLTVRVRAHDAKFVGTGVGDVKVAVRDAFTGEVVASGFITGGTGNTKALMMEPKKRDTVLSDASAAGFETVLDIDAPRKLEVEVAGPLSAGAAMHREVKTTWLIPGRDIRGDGILFEFYGLIVRTTSPTQHEFAPTGQATIRAHVTPMCGCPVRPGFIWDSKNFTVTAVVEKDGSVVATVPMSYAGKIGDFTGDLTLDSPGTYKVTVLASDDKNNQGADVTTFIVVPAARLKKLAGH